MNMKKNIILKEYRLFGIEKVAFEGIEFLRTGGEYLHVVVLGIEGGGEGTCQFDEVLGRRGEVQGVEVDMAGSHCADEPAFVMT